jgi:hypothetical protein
MGAYASQSGHVLSRRPTLLHNCRPSKTSDSCRWQPRHMLVVAMRAEDGQVPAGSFSTGRSWQFTFSSQRKDIMSSSRHHMVWRPHITICLTAQHKTLAYLHSVLVRVHVLGLGQCLALVVQPHDLCLQRTDLQQVGLNVVHLRQDAAVKTESLLIIASAVLKSKSPSLTCCLQYSGPHLAKEPRHICWLVVPDVARVTRCQQGHW